jgi:hypothetical protein
MSVADWIAPRPGPHHNPLRRRTDRIQAAARATLVAVFLIVGPLVALSVGAAVHAHGVRAEQDRRFPTTATLTQDAQFAAAEALQSARVAGTFGPCRTARSVDRCAQRSGQSLRIMRWAGLSRPAGPP